MTDQRVRTWPVWVLAAPAGVAIWSGWVGLGQMTGFGAIQPLPGTPLESWELDTAITLPIGMEVYAAYALWVWLSRQAPPAAARFARGSAIGALILGAAGQVAYHLMAAAGWTTAPWWITTVVACLPVAVLGMGAALRHLIHAAPAAETPVAGGGETPATGTTPVSSPVATSPVPGEAQTADSGAGGTPPANPPRSPRPKPAPAGGRRAPLPSAPEDVKARLAAAYVADALAAGRQPSRNGLTAHFRGAGYGLGTGPAEDLLKAVQKPHAVPEVQSA